MNEVHEILGMFENKTYKTYQEDRYKVISRPLYEDVEECLDRAIRQRNARDVFKYTQLKKELQKRTSLSKDTKFSREYIKRFLVKQPEIDLNTEKTIEEELGTKKPKSRTKAKSKKTEKKTEEQDSSLVDETVKRNAKEFILRNLPFKIYEECISKQRSQKYYMSKENLIKLIDETEELRELFKGMKKDFKKMNKEEICKDFFHKN